MSHSETYLRDRRNFSFFASLLILLTFVDQETLSIPGIDADLPSAGALTALAVATVFFAWSFSLEYADAHHRYNEGIQGPEQPDVTTALRRHVELITSTAESLTAFQTHMARFYEEIGDKIWRAVEPNREEMGEQFRRAYDTEKMNNPRSEYIYPFEGNPDVDRAIQERVDAGFRAIIKQRFIAPTDALKPNFDALANSVPMIVAALNTNSADIEEITRKLNKVSSAIRRGQAMGFAVRDKWVMAVLGLIALLLYVLRMWALAGHNWGGLCGLFYSLRSSFN